MTPYYSFALSLALLVALAVGLLAGGRVAPTGDVWMTESLSGAERITRERARHTDGEGFTPEHDAQFTNGELLEAAECYLTATWFLPSEPPFGWPFGSADWKPSQDRIRNLEKAGALIAAEIDRLLWLRKQMPEVAS